MKLTNEQVAFIDEIFGGTESIMLNAVAGSGKTTTIIEALKQSRVAPEHTLLLAFNKKIQQELEKRAPSGTAVRTLNGLGHRAWARHTGKKLLLDTKKVGSIVSSLCTVPETRGMWADIKDLVCKAKSAGLLHIKYKGGLVPDTEANWRSIASQHGITFNSTILEIARKALLRNIEQGLSGNIDFDDQLYMPVCFNASFDKFDLVIVDEAQDLSEIQHHIISKTVAKDGRLVLVGDPNQAIYGFRGAMEDSMQQLSQQFNAKELGLTFSFRCSKAAIAQAQTYVPRIQAFSENQEGSVTSLKDWKPQDLEEGSAVLCRNIAPLVKLGFQCIKENVSAYVAGRDIGAPLIKACKNLPLGTDLIQSIIGWMKIEKERANRDLELISRITDTGEALLAVAEISAARTPADLEAELRRLFAKTEGSLCLSTIHRAKGLEWNNVYFLDSWRIPQAWILRLVKENPASRWMLQQEKNLAYIAVTRTKNKLTYINYKGEVYGE